MARGSQIHMYWVEIPAARAADITSRGRSAATTKIASARARIGKLIHHVIAVTMLQTHACCECTRQNIEDEPSSTEMTTREKRVRSHCSLVSFTRSSACVVDSCTTTTTQSLRRQRQMNGMTKPTRQSRFAIVHLVNVSPSNIK